jgi:hypothetical protein
MNGAKVTPMHQPDKVNNCHTPGLGAIAESW